MMVRLRDFAEIHRITERTVQIHIKNNEEILEGHIERRGKQGTWLDDFAVEFLLERIQLPTKDEVLVPTPREAALLMQLSEANRKLAEAERRAGDNAEAAGKVLFLEENNKAQEARIHELSVEVGKLTQKVETEAQKAAEDARKAVEAQYTQMLAAAEQRAQDELTAAQEKAAEEQAAKEAWRTYAAALEEYNAKNWFQRRKAEKPVPPTFQEE